MLNDFNLIKINRNSISKKGEFSWHFFLCNFYSFKLVYKNHIIHPMLEEFSLFEFLLIQPTQLCTQFC